jgi:hypothetical protein
MRWPADRKDPSQFGGTRSTCPKSRGIHSRWWNRPPGQSEEGEQVLWAGLVEAYVVNAHPPFPILLLD